MRVISKSWSLIRIPVQCGFVRSKTYAGDTTEYTTIVPVTKFGDPDGPSAWGKGERLATRTVADRKMCLFGHD